MITELKGDLNDSKNFTKNIKVPKVKKFSVTEKGRFMTTCLICQKTCHGNCCIKDVMINLDVLVLKMEIDSL